MPKAAVEKNDDPLARKNKIGPARHRHVAPPAVDAGDTQQAYESLFGRLVAPGPNPRHRMRPLSGRHVISHGRSRYAVAAAV
jgi:hypothetical protein